MAGTYTWPGSRAALGHGACRAAALLVCGLAVAGCHLDMWNQDRYEPLEKGGFFGEGESSSRMLVAGTVPNTRSRDKTYSAYGNRGYQNAFLLDGARNVNYLRGLDNRQRDAMRPTMSLW